LGNSNITSLKFLEDFDEPKLQNASENYFEIYANMQSLKPSVVDLRKTDNESNRTQHLPTGVQTQDHESSCTQD